MHKRILLIRSAATVILISFMIVTVLPVGIMAQATITCPYDSAAPTLDHARQTFKALNYNCAEMEINDLLKKEDLSLEEKANAHVLMAAVYYAKLKDSKEKQHKVIEQFAQAFRSYANWSGDLDIKSTEFLSMMEQAKSLVETEIKVPETPALDTLVAVPVIGGKEKPWYTQWWAIGLGVGVVAGAVILMGGGGEEAAPDTSLAGFPPPPAKSGK
jgi:hypothetical protein